VQQVGPRRGLEQLAGEMRGAAAPRGGEGELARPRLGERDHIGDRVRRQLGIDRHDQRQLGEQNDRRKILDWIVGQRRVEIGADAVRRNRVEEERIAVGVRLGDRRGGDDAAGAAAVADDDRCTQRGAELGADDAGHEVGGAAGRHRDHQLDGSIRIGALRLRGNRLIEDKRSGRE
jgi:hypothetical protein